MSASTQNLMQILQQQLKFNPANVWGILTDGASNGINLINSAPLILGAGTALPFGEPISNFFTTVLGFGSDAALNDMGARGWPAMSSPRSCESIPEGRRRR
jgi:hypothetical protein